VGGHDASGPRHAPGLEKAVNEWATVERVHALPVIPSDLHIEEPEASLLEGRYEVQFPYGDYIPGLGL
jgi:hypothetical protein